MPALYNHYCPQRYICKYRNNHIRIRRGLIAACLIPKRQTPRCPFGPSPSCGVDLSGLIAFGCHSVLSVCFLGPVYIYLVQHMCKMQTTLKVMYGLGMIIVLYEWGVQIIIYCGLTFFFGAPRVHFVSGTIQTDSWQSIPHCLSSSLSSRDIPPLSSHFLLSSLH